MTNSETITAFAPATIGNIGCGFDILGMAVDQPGDMVTLQKSDRTGVRINKISGDQGKLPREANQNTAGVAALEFMKRFDLDCGIDLELEKNMPMGSGLGSSAASAAATLKALNTLFDNPANRRDLLKIGLKAEKAACGSEHADNIAPSLFGGIILVRGNQNDDIISIHVPKNLHCVLVYPHIEIRTEDARKILPKQVDLSLAVQQWGNVAGLISGFYDEDYDLIGRSMQDVVVEPVRSQLIPGFVNVQKSALENGALGCSLSGSGPTVFALTDSAKSAKKIGAAMQRAFEKENLSSQIWISAVNTDGAKIIEEE